MRKKLTIFYGVIILISTFLPLLPSQAADRQCAYYLAVLTVNGVSTEYQCSGLHNSESPLADCQNIGQKCCVNTNINPPDYFFQNPCNTNSVEEPDINKCLNSRKWKCCCHSSVYQQKETEEPKAPLFEAPKLQIDLPTLELTKKIQCTGGSDNSWDCRIPWIGEYVQAIYNYGLGIAGILAAIVLMAGGVVWLISAGDASRVSLAKELISGSVTGLIILMASYVLLIQINPELVNFKPIKIGAIKPIDIIPTPENTSQFSAKCKSTTTGACAVSNMSGFGAKANEASAICMAESGGNAGIYNSLTKCTNGEYAVWGLFQFNLSANKFTDENNVILNCPKAFNKTWTNNSQSCTVVDESLYNACVKAATNPTLSIMNAQKLVAASKGWGPWEANSKWCNF